MYSKSKKFTKSLSDIMRSKNEPAQSSSSSSKSSSEEVTSKKKKKDVEYPAFKFQDLGKDLNDQEMFDALVAIRKMDGQKQSVPVVYAMKGLKIPSVKETFRYSQPDIRSAPDISMYKRLKNAGLDRYSEPTTKLFRSNGTKKGLVNRMAQQLIAKSHSNVSTDMFRVVAQKLPFRKITKWDDFSAEHVCFENMNTKANAGFPYNFYGDKTKLPTIVDDTPLPLEYRVPGVDNCELLTKPMPIIDHAMYWTKKMLKIVGDAKDVSTCALNMQNFFELHPDLKTFMLKRKDEKMSRDDYWTKVRPYGSQPLPARFFCMFAMSFIEQNMKNFVEDPESISAYHFSPYFGGADRILQFFEHHYKQGKIFSGISYGDDQLWSIRLHDGTVIFLNPDVKAMDMNTQSDTVSLIAKVAKLVYKDIPPLHFKALVTALTMAFNHQMHVSGSFVVAKTQSLLSGIPGTTIINIFNSARIHAVVEGSLKNETEPITVKNIFKVLGRAFTAVKSILGYTFKGFEDLSFDSANKTSDEMWDKHRGALFSCSMENLRTTGIPLAFLSNIIQIIDGKPVCVPADLTKLGASLVLPGSAPEKKKIQLQMERLVGVAFSGGWVDKEFLEFLQTTYDSLRLVEDVPMEYSELNSNGEEDVQDVLETFNSDPDNPRLKTIPDYAFFYDMNTLDKEAFAEKYSGKDSLNRASKSVEKSAPSSKSSKDEVIYTTMSELKDTFNELDNLNFDDELPVPVDPKKAGNYNALNKEEEQEKIERQQKRWSKQRAQRFINSLQIDGKEKIRMRQMVEELDDGEDPFDYFDEYNQDRENWSENENPDYLDDEEPSDRDDYDRDEFEEDVVVEEKPKYSMDQLEAELEALDFEKSNYNDSEERTRLHK